MKVFLITLALVMLVSGCEGFGSHEVTVTVRDIETWSPVNMECSFAEGAEVSIYERSTDPSQVAAFSGTTNSSGEATFNLVADGSYYMIIEKVNSSNVISREVKEGKQVGYIIIDVLQTQEEANYHAEFPGKVLGPGDPKIIDVNADDIITPDDKQTGYHFIAEDHKDIYTYIADQSAID